MAAEGRTEGLNRVKFGKTEGVVFDIEKFATHDGPGIRTVVFLKGCPLRCTWCHSPESWNPECARYPDGTLIGKRMTVDEVVENVLRDKDFYEASGGGVTVSGGEPLMRWEFVCEIFSRLRKAGVKTAVETSGYAPPAAVEAMAAVTDLWLFDIKGLDPKRHLEHTRVDNASILANLRWLNVHGAKIVLRCPMIPGLNDFDANLVALGQLANELKGVEALDVEPYIPYGIDKAKQLGLKVYEAPQPPPEYASRIVERLRKLTVKPVRKG